jgi:hypothetical protein
LVDDVVAGFGGRGGQCEDLVAVEDGRRAEGRALAAGRVCVADVAVAGLVDHAVAGEHRVAEGREGADWHGTERFDEVEAFVDDGRVDAVVGPCGRYWYLAPLLR